MSKNELSKLILRTKYGRFPTSLEYKLAQQKVFETSKELEEFLDREEQIRKVADSLPDSWRVADPEVRREHAIEYLRKVNPGVLGDGNLRD